MSANNNNLQKNIGGPSPFGNSFPLNQSSQQQMGSAFPGQFQISSAQAQAFAAQLQSRVQAQAHAQAQAQAAAQFQTHMQAAAAAQGLSFNQANSGGVGSLGSPSPSISGAKRFPQKPPMRPPGFSPSNMTPSPLRTMEAAAAARKKKQRLSEKQLHERVAAILPESDLYTQLLEFESRVDASLTRKKIDIQEALKTPLYNQKTLRIYVFNTSANQTRGMPKKPSAEPPTWTLKIIGRILEEGADPDQAATQSPGSMYPKFSSFFKRVTITLDQKVYPDNHLIIWDSARSPAPQEGFEVKRKGEQEFTVSIRLEMNHMPEKFKLSSPLTELLGIEVDTRARIISAVWHYVKARKLQCPDDPSSFICDQPLHKVFGESKIKFTAVTQKITPHLFPPQPILLEHRIKLSGDSPVGTACYDVLVDVPFPIQRDLNALLANTEKTKDIETCDEAICGAIKKIHEHRRRRAFFLGFSQSPIEFINALIDSQSRDLKLVAGEASRNSEKERNSDFYNQPWVEDAVIRYLNRKPASDAAPGGM